MLAKTRSDNWPCGEEIVKAMSGSAAAPIMEGAAHGVTRSDYSQLVSLGVEKGVDLIAVKPLVSGSRGGAVHLY